MECFVCKKLNVSLSTEFISVIELSANDLQLLKQRLHLLITDENSYVCGSICMIHKKEYLDWYCFKQKICCDPFNKHPSINRTKSLKTISVNLSMIKPEILIPGKKLCISCHSSINSSITQTDLPTAGTSAGADDTITDPDFTEPTIAIEKLNQSCEILDLSPLKINRHSSKRKLLYMQSKVTKLNKCIADNAAEVLGAETISKPKNIDATCSDCVSMMEQLLNKFMLALSVKEKIQILTLVADSWTVQQTVTYFNTTEYLVKKARGLKSAEGVLAMPSGRKSVKLSSNTIKKVISFFNDDNNSRMCPGKKDCVSVPTENGRVLKQKRLILFNLKELYIAFKEQHEIKIGFSMFCSLRPKECVTVGSKGIHSVCVCVYHQNVKLMLHAIHMNDYMSLLRKLVCCVESEKCMIHRCENCPSPEILKNDLMLLDELEISNEVVYKHWVKTDSSELKTSSESVDEFVDNLLTKLSDLCAHQFFASAQSKYFKNTKDDLGTDTALILADFSENYTCIVQDAIQSFHWKKEQVTVHPFLAYIKDITSDTVKSISMCVISDHLIHDTTTFWAFQKVIVNHLLTQNPQIKYIKYFSDGSSAQYKNYKNFINLCNHEEDHGVKAEWHFFASCHGKGACDGIGGTIKRMATKASLQRPYTDAILNALDLYNFAKKSVNGIESFFVTKSEIEVAERQLADRYGMANTIKGTRSNHSFVPISNTQLRVSRVSGSSTTFIATVGLGRNQKTAGTQK